MNARYELRGLTDDEVMILERRDADHYVAKSTHADWGVFAQPYEGAWTWLPKTSGIEFIGIADLQTIAFITQFLLSESRMAAHYRQGEE